jgi:hypothetical protein
MLVKKTGIQLLNSMAQKARCTFEINPAGAAWFPCALKSRSREALSP